MKTTITGMVEALTKSFAEADKLDGQARTDLIEKNKAEFTEMMAKLADDYAGQQVESQAEELAKADGVYTGLGTVGAIANLAAMVANQVDAIQQGNVPTNGGAEMADAPTEEVMHLLDSAVSLLTLALRAAVNDHIDPLDDDDDPNADVAADGARLIMVKSAEAPDDDSKVFLAKTFLPDELGQFATDPVLIDQEVLGKGLELCVLAGVEEKALNKLFTPERELSKAFPPAAAGGGAAGGGMDDAGGDGQDGADQGDDSNPMSVAMRLCAALMIQLDAIQRAISGEEDAEGEGEGADQGDAAAEEGGDEQPSGAGQPAGGQDSAAPPKKKPPFAKAAGTADLSKAAGQNHAHSSHNNVDQKVADLEGQLTSLQERLAKLAADPMPVKGVVSTALPTATLSKAADTGGSGISLSDEDLAEKLAKMAPEEKAALMIKAAYRERAGG